MKRAVLAALVLGACSAPSAAVRVGPTPTVTIEPTTTSAPTSEGAGILSPVSSGPPPVPAEALTPPGRPAGAGGTEVVSWYGGESGTRTANGERYDPGGLTFAHRSLPFGTLVQFCRGGVCAAARCTDRGPEPWTGRDFDLSRGTFELLAPLSSGVATVTWTVLG
ncbi:MAG: septal ring lytic transglycosylase RlpA family protein [Actinomycetota bacterium]|nr:septal ring lytic transglycosylase RlpA family protein [Actinomycetota bacterium]